MGRFLGIEKTLLFPMPSAKFVYKPFFLNYIRKYETIFLFLFPLNLILLLYYILN